VGRRAVLLVLWSVVARKEPAGTYPLQQAGNESTVFTGDSLDERLRVSIFVLFAIANVSTSTHLLYYIHLKSTPNYVSRHAGI
jgi:hypothetical protein